MNRNHEFVSSIKAMFPLADTGGVAKNDLAVFMENGRVTPAVQTLPLTTLNNSTAGASTVRAAGAISSAFTPLRAGQYGRGVAQLANGSFVHVQSATSLVTFGFRDQSGAGGTAWTTVAADTANDVRVIPLTGGNFVVVWNVTTTLKYAVYNSAGAVVQATATVATIINAANAYSAIALGNGQFVIAYCKSSTNGAAFSQYNAAGVLQGSEVIIEAAIASTTMRAMLCANGDFVVAYFRATATTADKIARYNSSGVLQGSLTTILASAASLPNIYQDYATICECSGGNICVLAGTAATMFVFTSALVSVATAVSIGTVNTSGGSYAICAGLLDEVYAAYNAASSADVLVSRFTPSGVLAVGPVTATSFFGNTSGTNTSQRALSIAPTGLGVAVGGQVTAIGTVTYSAALGCFNSACALVGSVIVVAVSGANPVINDFSMVMGALREIAVQYFNTNSSIVVGAYYLSQKSSVAGIISAGAAAGVAARAELGTTDSPVTAQINQSMFAGGGATDQRAAAPPGARGFVQGNSAIFYGLT